MAPEDVAAHRASDGAAGVLRDEQALDASVIGARIEPERRAQRQEFRVDGKAAAGRQHDPLAADRALARNLAEKHVRGIGVEDVLGLRGMGREPGSDPRHGRVLAVDQAALDHHPPDRHIGPAVLAVEAHAHLAAVGQIDAARSLHLQEKRRHGITDPEETKIQAIESARLDLCAGLVGLEPAIDHAARDPLAPPVRAEVPELNGDQIGRAIHQGRLEAPATHGRAFELGLVIAGEQAFGRLVVGAAIGPEPRLEEAACGRIVALVDRRGRGTGWAPIRDRARHALAGSDRRLVPEAEPAPRRIS